MAGARDSSETKRVAADSAAAAHRPVVLFFGTSITAGYGLDPGQAYPSVVGKLADSAGVPITVVNAGLSGETTAGALRRIDWVLRTPADIVLIETGANDALRGLDPAEARSNIEQIVARVKRDRPGARILLAQMEAPPNYGLSYTLRFHAIYPDVAKREGLVLVPFLLNGVAGIGGLNQADGVHPNVAGARIVAHNVWAALEPLVKETEAAR